MKNDKLLFKGSEWTFDMLEQMLIECEKIGTEELGVTFYRNQIEVINSDQMLEAYVSGGIPVNYAHWSHGKSFLQQKQAYQGGQMGLAYEIVINTDPCIAYCMEDNTAAMQALVIAHASVGHNAFFKNNYLFKHWTDPSSIIDYMIFAKKYIHQCEERYGIDEVEEILDSAHALKLVSFDRSKRQAPISEEEEQKRRLALLEQKDKERTEYDLLIRHDDLIVLDKEQSSRLKDPEENLLYFLEKNSPTLKSWQREIIRIVRTINQYFYPNYQTQTMNEGFASFTHHYILNRLYEKGMITEGALLECMTSHSNVIYQQPVSQRFNPYALGFAIYTDIKRMCENPTKEDKSWFPSVAGKDWKEQLHFAMENFRDESFILQYLSPKVMRDFRMFALTDDSKEDHYTVHQIHNDSGYEKIRNMLSEQYRMENRFPNLMVTKADMQGDRTLTVEYKANRGIQLDDKQARSCLEHIAYLWGYNVELVTLSDSGPGFEISKLKATVVS